MHTVDPVSPLTASKTHFSLWWIWTSPKVALELEFMNPFPQRDVISLGVADLEELSSTGSHVYAKLIRNYETNTFCFILEQREKHLAGQKREKGKRARWEGR